MFATFLSNISSIALFLHVVCMSSVSAQLSYPYSW